MTMNLVRNSFAASLILLLSACGGGGGNGSISGGTTSEPPVGMTFYPATAKTSLALGSAPEIQIDAFLSRPISGVINVAIVDTQGVIKPELNLAPTAGTMQRAWITVSPLLMPGVHSGSLEVRLCRDDPVVCRTPIAGSPWYLPYEFTVSTPSATVTPTNINLDVFQDELLPMVFTANITNTSSLFGNGTTASVYPRFTDSSGKFDVSATQLTTSSSARTVTANVVPKSTLAPGTYSGNVELRLCTTTACTTEYSGSPITVPYNLTFRSGSNLTPLSRW